MYDQLETREQNMETFYVSMTTIRALDRWSAFMAAMLKKLTYN